MKRRGVRGAWLHLSGVLGGRLPGVWHVSWGLPGVSELGDALDQAGDDMVPPADFLAVQFFAPPELARRPSDDSP